MPAASGWLQVCTQVLSLPDGVSVNSVSVAAGHLSSASIYPACFAPYLLTTACSDGHVHFWRCELRSPANDAPLQSFTYVWKEWEMMIPKEANSSIRVQGTWHFCFCVMFQVLNFVVAQSWKIQVLVNNTLVMLVRVRKGFGLGFDCTAVHYIICIEQSLQLTRSPGRVKGEVKYAVLFLEM